MANTTSERIAANVRAELARRRLSGSALAEALAVPHRTMTRRLSGQIRWTAEDVESVANYLGVPMEALVSERAA